MNQSMQHLFSQIPRADIQRSVFDRHHTLKTAFNSGFLVPIFVDEALPGDTFNLDLSLFGRTTTMAVPIMDNLYLETFFFAVPNRLVWDNWQKFCGERVNPGDSIDFVIPTLAEGSPSFQSVYDYMGLPPGVVTRDVSALFFRAYNLIWNEWFRDENLQDSVSVPKGDGPDAMSTYTLLKRGKRHDYFTSCLPWPQKGPGVEISLGGTAPVWGNGRALAISYDKAGENLHTGLYPYNRYMSRVQDAQSNELLHLTTNSSGNLVGVVQPSEGVSTSGLYADLSNASAYTINSLREAFQVQRLLEADARGGTRYTEILRSHFGCISPDARLQRPEYLGGSSCRISVHPVAQQSATDSVTPQGNLAAFATMGDVQHIFTKSFVEHNIIIGLACVRADLTYQQGVSRMFTRRTRYDFYWPTLAHLGEQAVLNREIRSVYDGSDASKAADDTVFGYQERWAEYRYKPSQITGKLRSWAPSTLDFWHLAQFFSATPALNASFIEENPPLSRVLAVTGDEPQIVLDADFGLKCARPMPVYSVPGLIDHF